MTNAPDLVEREALDRCAPVEHSIQRDLFETGPDLVDPAPSKAPALGRREEVARRRQRRGGVSTSAQHVEARARYWSANQDETGDLDEFGTVAWCIEEIAAGRTVGPESGCPRWAPFMVEIAAADVGVDISIEWEDETRTLTLRPGPAGVRAPTVDGPRPHKLQAVKLKAVVEWRRIGLTSTAHVRGDHLADVKPAPVGWTWRAWAYNQRGGSEAPTEERARAAAEAWLARMLPRVVASR